MSMNNIEQKYQIVIEDGVLKQFDKEFEGEYVVPSIVHTIKAHAFKDCDGLTSVRIPASVCRIEKLAFNECCNLEYLSVEEGNPCYDSRENCCAIIETASGTLIRGCINTVIPEGVKRIGEWAFDSTRGLESIIIPSSVKVIDDWAFCCCLDLGEIYLPESLEIIGKAAFFECYSIKRIVLPDSLKIIGSGAFCECESLKSITIPSKVKYIWDEERPFSGCGALEYIRIDADNKYFDSRGNCNGIIETATNELIGGCSNTLIPNTVERIADKAFASTDIEAVIIPESVRHIGTGVFKSCEMLSHIVVNKNNSTYDSREDCNAIIHSGSDTLVSGCKKTVIPYGVAVIGAEAFYGISDLNVIEIPDSVHTIEEYAFAHCTGLSKVRIPDGVKRLHSNSFCRCVKLTLSIPADCEYISDQFDKVKKIVRRKAPKKPDTNLI